ncbi:MerR family transcriptional regulator, partial [Arthrobacter deserti]|nr:MerR family transcriptional regulator [Arthrobacter deserti]
ADLVGMAQPTLRLYERKGLLEPERTSGGTRRYSDDDLERLKRIGELVDAGVNLAGVDLVLRLEADNVRLKRDLDRARRR